ncbi:MAG: DUF3794 domain-containing protein [Clostridiales bacterium]|nr:DUF3794 domain-containing protein [Candidatus Cacconaster stercorequi]
MELGLQFEDLSWFDETAAISAAQEETMETAIPEYCPDMARIVDAVGQVILREKKLSDGRITVSGAVKVRVLYTSEESAGVRALVMPVPFSCQLEDKRLAACKTVCINSRLLLCEVKAVTSRKVYVRVMPELTATGYLPQRGRYCVGADPEIRVRREEWEAELLTEVTEREFPYTQEIMLDTTQPAPDDLLLDGMHLRIAECRHLGSKLVVKGEAALSVLYRAEGQPLCTYETTIPFSQILDGIDRPEDAAFDVYPQLQESELRVIRTDGGNGFGVTARILLTIFVREKRRVRHIADLYSTIGKTQTDRAVLPITADYRREYARQELTQKFEFGSAAPLCYVTQADCGQIMMGSDGDRTALRTTVRMKVLYLDESGAPMTTERTMEASATVDTAPENCWPDCGQMMQRMSGGSCEIRLPVEFLLCSCRKKKMSTIINAKLVEDDTREKMPSVVMRRMEPGETLWDIAKQYRTDEELIRSVNDLTEEAAGKMLLIPKIR